MNLVTNFELTVTRQLIESKLKSFAEINDSNALTLSDFEAWFTNAFGVPSGDDTLTSTGVIFEEPGNPPPAPAPAPAPLQGAVTHQQMLDALDTNNDGIVDSSELKAVPH